jgi:hypothetical protein
MEKFEFDAIIEKHEGINAAFIKIPFDAEKEFGKKGQIKVKVTFDDYEYRGSQVKMGQPYYYIGITQKIREIIGKNPGDTIHISIVQDFDKREIAVPTDLFQALNENPQAMLRFEKLSYTHKKEYVVWITSAKKIETRNNRIVKCLQMLEK